MTPENAPDGNYHATIHGETYLCMKKDGDWYYIDGTGWTLPIKYPEAISKLKSTDGLPHIERDFVYRDGYPSVKEFFK